MHGGHQCCGSGPGAFLTPGSGIRDPGWVKSKDPDPGSRIGMNNSDGKQNILFYYILFSYILFYSILFYSILFNSTVLYSILLYSTYTILFYSILFFSILFYSIHIS